jgi:hypothetical protein
MTGKDDRKKYPLRNGRYKIIEVYSRSTDLPDSLQRIGDHRVHNRGGYISLGHCMSDETKSYVRKRPGYLCRLLSYSIQPAVRALVNDGVPAAAVRKIEKWLAVEDKKFVELAEMARMDVISDWKGTTRNLEQRTGSVYQLAERFLDIVQRVMAEAGINVCSSCGLAGCGRVMGTQKECT